VEQVKRVIEILRRQVPGWDFTNSQVEITSAL
jgi:hypothetical protein